MTRRLLLLLVCVALATLLTADLVAQARKQQATCKEPLSRANTAALALQDASVRLEVARRDLELCRATGEHAPLRPFGAGKKSAIWPSGATIPVCWETTGYATEKAWVQNAIAQTWDASSRLTFTSWQACTTTSKGIRIRILDDGAHVNGLGKELNGMKNGMVLNFTFKNWSKPCAAKKAREACIRNDAVHEFGHAIALTHEQNRPDTPPTCRAEKQGTTGDLHVTVYDPNSIMNYCRDSGWPPTWNLSSLDIITVQKLYGKS